MSDANDVLFGSGIPAAKFTSPGESYGGPIVKLEATQMRKFDKKTNRPTDELDYWDNGDPKMQAVVTVRTQHRDVSDPSDDGQRKLYISSRYQQNAVKAAVKAAGKRQLEIGGILQLTYTHEAPSEAGPMAKFYEASYSPPSAAAANQALGVDTRGPGAVSAPSASVNPTQVQVPSVQQLIPAADPTAVQVTNAAPAANTMNLDNLPPEAQALVAKMLAAQQQS